LSVKIEPLIKHLSPLANADGRRIKIVLWCASLILSFIKLSMSATHHDIETGEIKTSIGTSYKAAIQGNKKEEKFEG